MRKDWIVEPNDIIDESQYPTLVDVQVIAEATTNGVSVSVTKSSDDNVLPYTITTRHEFGFGSGDVIANLRNEADAIALYAILIQRT